jgi:hypothetical protein
LGRLENRLALSDLDKTNPPPIKEPIAWGLAKAMGMARDFHHAASLILTAGLKTIAAVNRFVAAGLERNRSRFSASVADRGIHGPIRTAAPITASTGLLFPGGPARRATTGLVGESFRFEKLLFTSGKCEIIPAILACQCFVLVHKKTSIFKPSGLFYLSLGLI